MQYLIDALPLKIYGRPVGSRQRDDLPYGGWGGGSSNPSGAIPGAYYGKYRFNQTTIFHMNNFRFLHA